MVVAMVILTVLMTTTSAYFIFSLGKSKRVSSTFDDDRALVLAESGLHESFEAIRNGATGAMGTQGNPVYLGGGVFWVTATPQGPKKIKACIRCIRSGKVTKAS